MAPKCDATGCKCEPTFVTVCPSSSNDLATVMEFDPQPQTPPDIAKMAGQVKPGFQVCCVMKNPADKAGRWGQYRMKPPGLVPPPATTSTTSPATRTPDNTNTPNSTQTQKWYEDRTNQIVGGILGAIALVGSVSLAVLLSRKKGEKRPAPVNKEPPKSVKAAPAPAPKPAPDDGKLPEHYADVKALFGIRSIHDKLATQDWYQKMDLMTRARLSPAIFNGETNLRAFKMSVTYGPFDKSTGRRTAFVRPEGSKVVPVSVVLDPNAGDLGNRELMKTFCDVYNKERANIVRLGVVDPGEADAWTKAAWVIASSMNDTEIEVAEKMRVLGETGTLPADWLRSIGLGKGRLPFDPLPDITKTRAWAAARPMLPPIRKPPVFDAAQTLIPEPDTSDATKTRAWPGAKPMDPSEATKTQIYVPGADSDDDNRPTIAIEPPVQKRSWLSRAVGWMLRRSDEVQREAELKDKFAQDVWGIGSSQRSMTMDGAMWWDSIFPMQRQISAAVVEKVYAQIAGQAPFKEMRFGGRLECSRRIAMRMFDNAVQSTGVSEVSVQGNIVTDWLRQDGVLKAKEEFKGEIRLSGKDLIPPAASNIMVPTDPAAEMISFLENDKTFTDESLVSKEKQIEWKKYVQRTMQGDSDAILRFYDAMGESGQPFLFLAAEAARVGGPHMQLPMAVADVERAVETQAKGAETRPGGWERVFGRGKGKVR